MTDGVSNEKCKRSKTYIMLIIERRAQSEFKLSVMLLVSAEAFFCRFQNFGNWSLATFGIVELKLFSAGIIGRMPRSDIDSNWNSLWNIDEFLRREKLIFRYVEAELFYYIKILE